MNENSQSRPNLFILGAMKSGTTSLHSWLGKHPEVFMCEPKEPGYFVKELTWRKGPEWYLDLFAQANGAAIVGESSTEYTKLPTYRGVPERIAKFAPDARFIYVMRDPIHRSISHYWHNVRSKKRCERRNLMTALHEDSTLIDYSHYAMQLRPYFDVFGQDRVLTLTLEKLTSNTDVVMRDILTWLGISPDGLRDTTYEREHQTPQVVTQKIGWLSRFRHTPVWNRLGPLVPPAIRRFGLKLSVHASIDRRNVPVDEAIEFLRPTMHDQVTELCELLHRDFNEWSTISESAMKQQPEADHESPTSVGC